MSHQLKNANLKSLLQRLEDKERRTNTDSVESVLDEIENFVSNCRNDGVAFEELQCLRETTLTEFVESYTELEQEHEVLGNELKRVTEMHKELCWETLEDHETISEMRYRHDDHIQQCANLLAENNNLLVANNSRALEIEDFRKELDVKVSEKDTLLAKVAQLTKENEDFARRIVLLEMARHPELDFVALLKEKIAICQNAENWGAVATFAAALKYETE